MRLMAWAGTIIALTLFVYFTIDRPRRRARRFDAKLDIVARPSKHTLGLWLALCPQLDMCVQGTTRAQAIAALRDGIRLYLKHRAAASLKWWNTVDYERSMYTAHTPEDVVRLAEKDGASR